MVTTLLIKFFRNRPDLFHSSVHKSLLKTKHLAVIVCDACCGGPSVVSNIRVAVNVFDHRDHNIDRLRRVISLFQSMLLDLDLVTTLLSHLSLSSYFVNEIICDAELDIWRLSLAEKINLLITQSRSSNLNKLANANPKQLWAAVKGSVNLRSRSHSSFIK